MVRYQAGQGEKLVIKTVASEKTLANSKFVKTTAILPLTHEPIATAHANPRPMCNL